MSVSPAVSLLEILHVDGDLVVCAKPAGMPTEPTRQGPGGTALAALVDVLSARGEDVSFLHAAHRLDADTSGVVVFARNAATAALLGDAFAGRRGAVAREYLALVRGAPQGDALRFDQALSKPVSKAGKGAQRDTRVVVDPAGQPSLTKASVLARSDRAALLRCVPETGRTHQIRVHLAHAGTPLVGDRRYGPADAVRSPHLGLHALALALPHPRHGRLKVTAPLPAAFFLAANAWGFDDDAVRAAGAKP